MTPHPPIIGAATLPDERFDQALEHHHQHNLAGAGKIYREILRENPGHVGAMQNLIDVLCTHEGRHLEAVPLGERANDLKDNDDEGGSRCGCSSCCGGSCGCAPNIRRVSPDVVPVVPTPPRPITIILPDSTIILLRTCRILPPFLSFKRVTPPPLSSLWIGKEAEQEVLP